MDNRPPAAPPVADPSPELLPVCPACGYDLRGLTSDRCPECGLTIDRAAVSRIPWVHRARIGRFRAYWRTAWMATARTAALAAEVQRPVDLRDGQTFRWINVLIAWVPLAGLTAWAGTTVSSNNGFAPIVNGHISGVVFNAINSADVVPLGLTVPYTVGLATPGVLPAAALLALVLLTGAASYFFHPRRLPVGRQNRAVAASYFACAPLALLPIPTAAVLVALLYDRGILGEKGELEPYGVQLAIGVTMTLGTLLILAALAFATLRLLRRTTLNGVGRQAASAVAILLLWAASITVPIVGVPWVVGFVRLMVASLRPG